MMIHSGLRGWRIAAGLLVLYGLAWLALEGNVRQDILLGALILIVLVWYLAIRYLGGRALSLSRWLAIAGVCGMLCGGALVLLMLFLMALKTGLHGHGPEYSAAEVAWVWAQLPLWIVTGLVGGLGLGLVLAGLRRA